MHRQLLAITCLFFFRFAEAQNPGDNLFGSDQLIHEVRITLPVANWHDTLTSYYNITEQLDSSIYLMGTLEVDGQILDSVGFKYKGNSSYNNSSQKKSWKISTEEFTGSNEIDDLNELNLNNGFKDPSFMREKLYNDFLQRFGMPGPRTVYANVYVNNQLRGLYVLVEEADKKFLKTRFGNKGGNLFKGDPHGDLRWKGSATPSLYYPDYELCTNEDANDWNGLIKLIDKLNNTPAQSLEDSLNKYFNTASYVKSWAATILFSSLDSYTGSGHNYFIYQNDSSNYFDFINWDANECFGNFKMAGGGGPVLDMFTLPMDYIPTPVTNRPLHNRMKDVPNYWNDYQNFICNALDLHFNSSYMDSMIDSLHNAISPSVYADPFKPYTNAQFEQNITSDVTQGNFTALGLKIFVQQRNAYLTQQLASFTCTPIEPPTAISEAQKSTFDLFPNPSSSSFVEVQLPASVSGYYQLFDITGREIISNAFGNAQRLSISTTTLQSGTYFFRLQLNSGETMTKKFVRL